MSSGERLWALGVLSSSQLSFPLCRLHSNRDVQRAAQLSEDSSHPVSRIHLKEHLSQECRKEASASSFYWFRMAQLQSRDHPQPIASQQHFHWLGLSGSHDISGSQPPKDLKSGQAVPLLGRIPVVPQMLVTGYWACPLHEGQFSVFVPEC